MFVIKIALRLDKGMNWYNSIIYYLIYNISYSPFTLDQVISYRFEHFQFYEKLFDFLFSLEKLKSFDDDI